MKLQLWDVEPPGVERFEHHVVKLRRVAVTAVLDDLDRVLMVWRYRFVPQQFGWMAKTRQRPLYGKWWRKRAGGPGRWSTWSLINPWSAWSTHRTKFFVGYGAEQVGAPTDLEEAGHVEWVPLANIPGLMARGELMGSGTLVALLHILASRRVPGVTDVR